MQYTSFNEHTLSTACTRSSFFMRYNICEKLELCPAYGLFSASPWLRLRGFALGYVIYQHSVPPPLAISVRSQGYSEPTVWVALHLYWASNLVVVFGLPCHWVLCCPLLYDCFSACQRHHLPYEIADFLVCGHSVTEFVVA